MCTIEYRYVYFLYLTIMDLQHDDILENCDFFYHLTFFLGLIVKLATNINT